METKNLGSFVPDDGGLASVLAAWALVGVIGCVLFNRLHDQWWPDEAVRTRRPVPVSTEVVAKSGPGGRQCLLGSAAAAANVSPARHTTKMTPGDLARGPVALLCPSHVDYVGPLPGSDNRFGERWGIRQGSW